MKVRKKGFTLIEVVLSIMLLGIISISILPMSIYAVKYTKWNNIRLTALNLAYSQVEWLKTLDYKDLGLNISGYSPKGKVEPNNYMENSYPVEINGVKYKLYTSIYWENAISSTGEPVPQAIKKIDVTVEANDLNSGGIKEYAVLGTLVTMEGEREYSEPGHIIAKVYLRSVNSEIKNVKIGLGQSQVYTEYTNTDEKGEALFGNLNYGEYKIEPISWKYDYLMTMPNGIEKDNKGIEKWRSSKSVIVPKWDKNKIDEVVYPTESFLIDLPGSLNIIKNEKYPMDILISIKPTGESYIPSEGESPNHMLLTATIKDINNIKFWRLWNYEYVVTKNEEKYLFVDNSTNKLWDGRFDTSNLSSQSNIDLFLAFALDEEGTFTKETDYPSRIKEIIIGFTSSVINHQDIEFQLNNNLISNDLYSITPVQNKNNTKFRITFNQPIDNYSDNIELKIINSKEILNNYGMYLSQDKNISILNIK